MSRIVRIDEDIWKAMKREAEPLEDAASDVLRRIFVRAGIVLDDGPAVPSPRVRAGDVPLDQKEYWKPVLRTLVDLGGGGWTKDVREQLETRLADRLNDADRAIYRAGQSRAWYTAQVARLKMIDERLMGGRSRGYWEITDAGRDWLAQHEGE